MATTPPSAPTQQKKAPSKAKVAGVIVLFIVAVAAVVYRMPKSRQVEAHADKPRSRPGAEAQASPAAAPQPRPAPAPQAKPAEQAVPVLSTTAARAEPVTLTEVEDRCAAERGILCHGTVPKELPRCLLRYGDVLLTECRETLSGWFEASYGSRPSELPADEGDESEDGIAPLWQDACATEAGILCHNAGANALAACLIRYDDVLMKSCRQSLRSRR